MSANTRKSKHIGHNNCRTECNLWTEGNFGSCYFQTETNIVECSTETGQWWRKLKHYLWDDRENPTTTLLKVKYCCVSSS
jgi:hypothetical protein